MKNTISTSKKLPTHVWSEVGASHQDSTSRSSETPGGLENAFDPEEFMKDQEKHQQKKKHDTIENRAREAGL